MRNMQRRIISSLLTTIMCLGLFFTTGLEAKAADQVAISIEYLYVKDDGSNAIVTKMVNVDKGTTWNDFLEVDEYKPENVIGASPSVKRVGIQRCFYAPDSISYFEDEIKNFNRYTDYALLEYYLYPDDYKEADFGFEYYEGDEIKDSGKGWTLLIPTSCVDGSEEAFAYIRSNFTIYDYLRDISNISGVELTISDYNGMYVLTFKAPAKSTNKTENSEKTEEVVQRQEPEQVQEVVVTEPTSETIADPSKAVTYIQAVNSINKNIDKIETDIKEGKVPANSPASINLGRYHSLSINTMTKFENVSVDVVLTYQYKGKTYTVKIPKGYKFDKNVSWYGPLYMYQLFGQSIK